MRLLIVVEVEESRCNMAYMYILKCSDNSYYTGSTKNLEQRLWQHKNAQGANYTKVRLPLELVYTEYYERIDEAFAREKQIQKWSRKKKEALINGDIDTLCNLSKSHFGKLSNQIHDKKKINTRCLSSSNDRCLSLSKAQKNTDRICP